MSPTKHILNDLPFLFLPRGNNECSRPPAPTHPLPVREELNETSEQPEELTYEARFQLTPLPCYDFLVTGIFSSASTPFWEFSELITFEFRKERLREKREGEKPDHKHLPRLPRLTDRALAASTFGHFSQNRGANRQVTESMCKVAVTYLPAGRRKGKSVP